MSENRSGLAVGVTVFAATLMIMIGFLHAMQGLVALFNDTFYVVREDWIFSFDVTTWGWVHLLLGILVAVAGFFLFSGAVWARTVGVVLAVVSVVANFVWLPYYPVWALVIIALDVFVIWALTVHGRDIVAQV
ncbi:hypothetical protein Cch01nite_18090 [Cellulomonas chitinilytica]|uniref:DUF7144 domain-containing protein n=1 Tax=Cellulomonas chitinilytica TaxID=398759 RepID=A0A919P1T8_9CELL|nr:hypothetical protein [Cellulomonas chitinilytica]GIG21085.1 hypothetical protein Cch01nite_18090 [Cellulomonas chitinilytica]